MTPVVVFSFAAFFGVALTDELRRRHERALRDAIHLSGSTMLQASQEAEIDQAQFTRQIQLLEGSHKRLAMQPRAFWRWYAVTLTSEFGLPTEAKRAARLALAAIGRKHMAPMALPATVRLELPLAKSHTNGRAR
jgi:hypothetical protein